MIRVDSLTSYRYFYGHLHRLSEVDFSFFPEGISRSFDHSGRLGSAAAACFDQPVRAGLAADEAYGSRSAGVPSHVPVQPVVCGVASFHVKNGPPAPATASAALGRGVWLRFHVGRGPKSKTLPEPRK